MLNLKNKWTTIAGLVVVIGTLVGCAGHLMMGDMGALDCLKNSWIELVAGAGLLKASDGGL